MQAQPLHKPADGEFVSSFETGIITLKGEWVGVCIKLAMFDRSEKIMHWQAAPFRALMASLVEFGQYLGPNSFMRRAEADSSLAENLDPRHPWHTLLTEVPKLTTDEIGGNSPATTVIESTFAIRGSAFEIRPCFGDQHTENIFFHDYTALSMYGYLEKMLEAAKILTGPAGGHA
jgi:hypothetical protein